MRPTTRTTVLLKRQALWDCLALLGRSQNWLARELGISPGYLSVLVNTGHAPSERIRLRMQKGARRAGVRRPVRRGGAVMNARGTAPCHSSNETGGWGGKGHFALCDVGILPDDFPERLRMLKEVVGLTWNGFADALGVDTKQVLRWRRGAEPCGGAMVSIFRLAGTVRGGLDIIMGEGFLASLGVC